ncbi:MAG: amino acid ABC transporter permease [Bdellovibrionota bacterium]
MQQTPPKHSPWNDPKVRSITIQVLIVLAFVLFAAYFINNTIINLTRQGIASGFDFLSSTAGFAVVQSLIDFDESSSYGRAFWVGLINTLLVSSLGIIIATIIGFIVGIARLSKNWLLKKIASTYIETLRNIPLLLQIFFWYFVVLRALPHPRDSYQWLNSFFVNNRGLYLPAINVEKSSYIVFIVFVLSTFCSIFFSKWSRKRQIETGKTDSKKWILGILFIPNILALLLLHKSFSISFPVLKGFNFQGGIVLIPELIALLAALSTYTGSFIAEIVRSGILSISKGQIEAAYSLGLKPNLTMRLIIIPQALRVIIPPLTSQYLNLTKNSSLAAAIGYPDLVAVFAGTVLNQTGQAVEVIAITMTVYLILSLSISAFMNWYNNQTMLIER